MNKKIYELAKQADLIEFDSIPGSTTVTPTYESVVKAKKFAELIMKECAVPMITKAHEMDVDGRYKNHPTEVIAGILHEETLKYFEIKE